LYIFMISLKSTVSPTHPLLPDVIILIKLGIGCNVWSSSYRSLH
jgi:hypothetical protein